MLNPEDAFAQWPVKIGRIEVDDTGTRTYTMDNSLYTSLSANNDDIALYDIISDHWSAHTPDIRYSFPSPSAGDLTEMQSNGYAVQNLAQGAVRVFKSTEEILVEPASMRTTTTRYESGVRVERHVPFR